MSDAAKRTAITAVILAAGKGTRMRSERPKVLHEICGRSLLSLVIRAARGAGADEIVVVVGHGRERVERSIAASDVRFAVQDPPRGTGDALLAAREAVGTRPRTLLLLYGDVPLMRPATLRELLERHRARDSRMTVLSARVEDPTGYGRILRDERREIKGIREELDASAAERALREVNTGIYAFESPGVFSVLEALEPNPRKGEIYLTDAVAAIRGKGGGVCVVEGTEATEFAGVNGRADLARAAAALRARILEDHMERGVTIVDPATAYIDEGVEIGADTVVHPCTVIRRGVRIGAGCEVGPFAHLRSGTVLEDGAAVGNFTEVKNSTLGERSKAKHLTYLGDARVGREANVGAGTITANYDGRRKWKTSIGEKAFIGSGTVFVAPCEVEDGGSTGAGAVLTRGSRVGEGEVFAGVPAKKLVPSRKETRRKKER